MKKLQAGLHTHAHTQCQSHVIVIKDIRVGPACWLLSASRHFISLWHLLHNVLAISLLRVTDSRRQINELSLRLALCVVCRLAARTGSLSRSGGLGPAPSRRARTSPPASCPPSSSGRTPTPRRSSYQAALTTGRANCPWSRGQWPSGKHRSLVIKLLPQCR